MAVRGGRQVVTGTDRAVQRVGRLSDVGRYGGHGEGAALASASVVTERREDE
jgi:hypothetical protein